MLQRNPLAYPLVFPTTTPPLEVAPAATIDYPTLLAGLEPAAGPHAPSDTPPGSDPADDDTPAVPVTPEES